MEVKRDFIYDPSLVLYLPLYELDGASFMSRDAYGHLATVTGALWRPNGRAFDGDDLINCADIVSGISAFWLSFWFNLDSLYEAGVGYSLNLFHKRADASNYIMVWLSPGTGSMYVEKRTGGVNDFQIRTLTRTSWPADIWYRIDIYFGTNYQAILVDGEVSGSDTQISGNLLAGDFIIGNLTGGGPGGHKGHIGEVNVYQRVPPIPEIQHNYLATKWRYR